jgi:hypothetical protein
VFTTYILGPILTLLPERWRRGATAFRTTDAARDAAISGLLECLAVMIVLLAWHPIYLKHVAAAAGHLPSAGSRKFGIFGDLWFWLSPITWVAAYFGLEGVARSLTAATSGEVYATMPLLLVEWVARGGWRDQGGTPDMRKPDPRLPVVKDEVVPNPNTSDIKISSCRPKDGWEYPFTIRYEGLYYQVMTGARATSGVRPYVYTLRRLPPGEPAHGLKDYKPEDVLAVK